MSAGFNENRHGQLLNILAQGGFVRDYVNLCGRFPRTNYADERPKLDFDKITGLFKACDPSAKALKRWRMIEFGRETTGGWMWTGSLVIKKYDSLDPMMSGVTEDGAESVGSTWINLTSESRMLLPEDIRPSHEDYSRPQYDGSMQTMERMVSDLVAMFERMKGLIRHGWANTDQASPPQP